MNINTAFPSNYLKAGDLAGTAVSVTIREVAMEEVGRTKEKKPVVYFVGKDKGVVLNRVNSNKIAELAGSFDTEDWGGTVIALYPTETEFAGETVECIRVRAPKVNGKPKAAPAAAETTEDEIPF
jgi:hypothetical protein